METTAIWANILKKVRENEPILLHIISNLFITFTTDKIILHAENEGAKKLLTKYLPVLEKYAETENLFTIKLKKSVSENLNLTEKLQNLCGDKTVTVLQ